MRYLLATIAAVLTLVMVIMASDCKQPIEDHVVPIPVVVEIPYESDIFTDEMAEHMYTSTVRILAKCLNNLPVTRMGSGFIGPNSMIYTARHVVDCGKDITGNQIPALIVIITHDRTEYASTVIDESSFGKDDTARLIPQAEITGGRDLFMLDKGVMQLVEGTTQPATLKHHAEISLRTPKIGERVCFVGGAKNPELLIQRKCGEVFKVHGGSFWLSAYTSWGNSGGPIYDSEGSVIGIAIQMNGPRSEGDIGMLAQRAGYAFLDVEYPTSELEEEVPDTGTPDAVPVPRSDPEPQPPKSAPPDAGAADAELVEDPEECSNFPLLEPQTLQERTEGLELDL